jgi:hypothetical protein
MKKPKVITNCVANHYSDPDQRIVELSSDGGGGLISLYVSEVDGVKRLTVELYHLDPTVDVFVDHGQVIRQAKT